MSKNIPNIKDRVLQIADNQEDIKQNFFRKVKLNYSNFTGKSKQSDLNSSSVAEILLNYPAVNPNWLLTGKGNMLLKDNYNLDQPSNVNGKGKGVPYYDVDFIGGFDLVINDTKSIPDSYIDIEQFNDADCWVNITGKSMSPFISHGDIVALKKLDSWKDFMLMGEIYAIITADFRTIKIIGKADEDHLMLIPYNTSKEFCEQPIPKRIIQSVFKVKGSIKKFF